jgi:hypothetical protein
MNAVQLEITEGDMEQLRILMAHLTDVSKACDGRVEALEFRVVLDGQPFVVGYGESGEPAVLVTAAVGVPVEPEAR